jgi:hypothetical protein
MQQSQSSGSPSKQPRKNVVVGVLWTPIYPALIYPAVIHPLSICFSIPLFNLDVGGLSATGAIPAA